MCREIPKALPCVESVRTCAPMMTSARGLCVTAGNNHAGLDSKVFGSLDTNHLHFPTWSIMRGHSVDRSNSSESETWGRGGGTSSS
jgi:hypothetical protein